MTEKSKIQKVRRHLLNQGYVLKKSRIKPKSKNSDNFGGYMILNLKDNSITAGAKYSLTLEKVESFIQTENLKLNVYGEDGKKAIGKTHRTIKSLNDFQEKHKGVEINI